MGPLPFCSSIRTSSRIRVAVGVVAFLLPIGLPIAAEETRDQQQEKLNFLVGTWDTAHSIPSRDGEPTVVRGEAVISWAVGDSWLRHEFEAEFPGRGRVSMTNLMNYSPTKKMYNFYMFDHFGGEAGAFYGNWNASNELVLTARFEEEDGSVSYQKFTLARVSADEIRFNRAFSNDGETYHFELRGVYTRNKQRS